MVVVYKPPTVLTQPDQSGDEDNLFDAVRRHLTAPADGVHSVSTQTRGDSPQGQPEGNQRVSATRTQAAVKPTTTSTTPSAAVSSSTTPTAIPDSKHPSTRNTHTIPSVPTLHLIHRLDRPCSGVVVFAKTAPAAAALNECFRTRQTSKHSLCVVNGEVVVEGGEDGKGRMEGLGDGAEEGVGAGRDGGCNVYRHWIQKTQAERVRCYNMIEAEDDTNGRAKGSVSGSRKGSGGDRKNKGSGNGKQGKTDDLVEAVLRCYPLVVISPFGLSSSLSASTSSSARIAGVGGSVASSSGDSAISSSNRDSTASMKSLFTGVASTPPQPPPVKQTVCRIELETGRKHQIRAQMAHMGHPIVGDVKYGASQSFKQRDIALHAYMLTIAHPVTGKDMTFTAPPPALWSKRFGADSLAAAEGEMTAP